MDPVSTALGTVLGVAAGYYWRGDSDCSDISNDAALPDVQHPLIPSPHCEACPKCPESAIQTCEVCIECPQMSDFGQSVDSGGHTLLEWKLGIRQPQIYDIKMRKSYASWEFVETSDWTRNVVNGGGFPVDIGSETDANRNFNIDRVQHFNIDAAPYLKCDAPLIQNGSLAVDSLNCTIGYDEATEQNRTCYVRGPVDGSGYARDGENISLANVTVTCPQTNALLTPIV